MRQVEPEALTLLCSTAMVDIAHLLRSKHLRQLAKILEDPEVGNSSIDNNILITRGLAACYNREKHTLDRGLNQYWEGVLKSK